MAFGLFFDNIHSRRQIDDRTPTISLISKGTGTASSGVMGSSTTRTATLSFSGRTAPMIAVGVDKPGQGDKGFQVLSATLSGGTWTYEIAIWHQYGTDFGFRWYLFDVPFGTALPSFGFALWDEQGRLTASSNMTPMPRADSMVSGGLYAAVYHAPFIYNENWWWDTTAQRDRVDWSLYADAVATYAGAAAMSGFIAGGESFTGPTIPWPHSQTMGPMTPLFVDVTGL